MKPRAFRPRKGTSGHVPLHRSSPHTPTENKPPPPPPPLRAHAASASRTAAAATALTPSEKTTLPSAAELRSALRSLLGAGGGGGEAAAALAVAVVDRDSSPSSPPSPPSPASSPPSNPLVPVEYEFNRSQERAFLELDSAMTRCATRYFFLALASAAAAVFLGIGGSHNHHHHRHSSIIDPHEWIAIAEAAQALAVSVFLWAAGEPFALIAQTRGSDLAHLLRGLNEVAHALLEATIMSCGLCLLFAASAAALQPQLAFPAIAAMSVAATLGRATLHRHPRALPPLLEAPEKIVKFLTAPLRVFDRKKKAARLREMLRREKEQVKEEEKKVVVEGKATALTKRKLTSSPSSSVASSAVAVDEPASEYEFTTEQEKVFRLLVRSLHVLCYSRIAHSATELLVAVAAFVSGDAVGALAAAVGSLEVAATAQLFWSASHAFNGVISSSGNDIKLLLKGVASAPSSKGLACMFTKLAHVSELALMLKIVPLALAWVATAAKKVGSVEALREVAAGVVMA